MNYRKEFSLAITASLHEVSLECVFLNPRNVSRFGKDDNKINDSLSRYLCITEKFGGFVAEQFTPCTACYNSKLITLTEYLVNNRYGTIAFGHHATDAVVSYLKSFVMYYDRWFLHHKVFFLSNFKAAATSICQAIANSSFVEKCDMVQLMLHLSASRLIGTDEPPVEIAKVGGEEIKVIRPLFLVPEHEIKIFSRSTQLHFNSFDCGHLSNGAQSSPRDIIHFLFFGGEQLTKQMKALHEVVLQDILGSLNDDGTLSFNARRNRDSLLGAEYKPNNGVAVKL